MRAVNLLPRDEPKRKKMEMTIGTQLALVAPFVVASLLVAGYLLESSKVNDNRATLKALQQELAALPPPKTTPTGPDASQLAAEKSQRIAALASALQSRVAWDRILREISSVLPEDVWLTQLSAQSPSAAAPAPAPAPAPTSTDGTDTTGTETTPAPSTPAPAVTASTAALNISGYTYSQEGVARFLGRLAIIPELQDVKLVSSTKATVSGRDVVQFAITAGLRPEGAA